MDRDPEDWYDVVGVVQATESNDAVIMRFYNENVIRFTTKPNTFDIESLSTRKQHGILQSYANVRIVHLKTFKYLS